MSIQTGADVRLCNNGRNPGDSAQAIGLCGQPKSVNRAIQMVQAAVLTHFPAWQFPLWVERLVQDFKRAETERLASVLSSTSNGRWSLNHITFVPEETIPSIKQAIHANVFVVSSCAIVKIDPVLVGKVTLDAPTSHQADAALIQLCDVVRNTVPGWAPESGTAREVILEADKQAGPGTTKAISTW